MKDSFAYNILERYKNVEKFAINSNNLINQKNKNFSFNDSYKNLEQTRNIELSIIDSRISLKEKINYSTFEKSEFFLKIKEIIKKYKNFPLININQIQNKSLNPKPFNDKVNFNLIHQNLDYNLLPIPNKNELINKKHSFLNRKRKAPSLKHKKILNKNKVFITSIKEKDEEKEKNSGKIKKIIFKLNNKCKDLNIKKHPGRKKKNSGEIGTHNKFSKDNMMRKLKNKILESSRKLINRMIKLEAGEDYKSFGEMRKIKGIFCQELNIKFNSCFYAQSLKTIFQFKMSSRYSKGNLNSNHSLISKIYSHEFINKFPKTIKILELMFHQYYHNIFLGEKNWTNEFNIPEEENKYQIDYFLNSIKLKEKEEEIKYNEKMQKLAKKYELFFLKKNQRKSYIIDEEKISITKKMINNISLQEHKKYKYYFIKKSVEYLPEIEKSYSHLLKKFNNNYDGKFEKTFISEINNKNDKDKHINLDNIIINQKEKEKEDKIQISAKNKLKMKENSEPIKSNIKFILEKNNFSRIIKENNKEEKNGKKKINFIINKMDKKNKIKFISFSKDKKDENMNHKNSKNLFIINKYESENTNYLTESNITLSIEKIK